MHFSQRWGKHPTLFPETSHLFPAGPWKAGGGVYTPGPWGQVTRLEIPGHERSGVNSPVPTWAVSLCQLLSWLSWDPTVSWLIRGTELLSLLNRVQGGKTQDTPQASGLQLYLQPVKLKDCWSAARIYCPSAGEEIPSLQDLVKYLNTQLP